jgi:phosphoribosylglycinamide formyltransferase-1
MRSKTIDRSRNRKGVLLRNQGELKVSEPRNETRPTKARRERLVGFCESLPEVVIAPVGEGHYSFKVRKKTFAYYLFDHHGDGEVAICFKALKGVQQRLIAEAPERYFVPAYLGVKGWVSLRLDGTDLDWAEVTNLLIAAYRLTAPKSLAATV